MEWDKIAVLVVDDEDLIRKLLTTLLRQIGVRTIHTADNGEDALKLLRTVTQIPDVIISDLQMPVMNGLAFAAKLRAEPDDFIKNIPLLVCTTVSKQDVVEEAVRLGVDGFIVKPIAPDALEERLRGALKRRRTDD